MGGWRRKDYHDEIRLFFFVVVVVVVVCRETWKGKIQLWLLLLSREKQREENPKRSLWPTPRPFHTWPSSPKPPSVHLVLRYVCFTHVSPNNVFCMCLLCVSPCMCPQLLWMSLLICFYRHSYMSCTYVSLMLPRFAR